ncbi:S-layer homology domain-containing protein [Sedimentibacter sp. zth1]|uniref:S-layer homology domain-containing protein n=1 Tax=Sedimentibacter sp. zth1 TaxID=2816908 RepID=UPI001A91BE36|nr:S-layer homology domain-containing protein [Sedimentibacter sp. zth1]QSX04860.1 S-layer homology domain-containing protein [Sedimentibacter sp. zth1]
MKIIKKILSIMLMLSIVISSLLPIYAVQIKEPSVELDKVIENTAKYVLDCAKKLKNDETLGEWTIISLIRAGIEVPEKYYDDYYNNLVKQLEENDGILHKRKYTEYSRAVLTLTALGKDPTNVGGYDLTEKLAEFDNLVWQGINGAVWGLIALDSGNYDVTNTGNIKNVTTRQKLVDHILSKEINGGGWSMGESNPDTDVTAMVLQSLANYVDQEKVKDAVDRGLVVLSNKMNNDGGFESWGNKNSESADQVLVALCKLNIDPKIDDRFVKKNGSWVVSNIIDDFYIPETGGFKHVKEYGIDGMATDQGMYAMVAYSRFLKGQTSLYDMSDVEKKYEEKVLPKKNTEPKIEYKNKFTDIDSSSEKEAIIGLNAKGIVNGFNENTFNPKGYVTRAQLATMLAKALCLEEIEIETFEDVKDSDWFSGYVGAAHQMGIINGYSDKVFKPNNNVTRQDAALMIARTAEILGKNMSMENYEIINIMCQFTDYIKCADWTIESVAACVKYGYIPDDEMEIYPERNATREEIAGMIFRMIEN